MRRKIKAWLERPWRCKLGKHGPFGLFISTVEVELRVDCKNCRQQWTITEEEALKMAARGDYSLYGAASNTAISKRDDRIKGILESAIGQVKPWLGK